MKIHRNKYLQVTVGDNTYDLEEVFNELIELHDKNVNKTIEIMRSSFKKFDKDIDIKILILQKRLAKTHNYKLITEPTDPEIPHSWEDVDITGSSDPVNYSNDEYGFIDDNNFHVKYAGMVVGAIEKYWNWFLVALVILVITISSFTWIFTDPRKKEETKLKPNTTIESLDKDTKTAIDESKSL